MNDLKKITKEDRFEIWGEGYRKGYNANKWFKLSNTKPRKDGIYLVIYNDSITLLCYNEYNKCWDNEDMNGYCCDIDAVTYWQVLPTFPEEN